MISYLQFIRHEIFMHVVKRPLLPRFCNDTAPRVRRFAPLLVRVRRGDDVLPPSPAQGDHDRSDDGGLLQHLVFYFRRKDESFKTFWCGCESE